MEQRRILRPPVYLSLGNPLEHIVLKDSKLMKGYNMEETTKKEEVAIYQLEPQPTTEAEYEAAINQLKAGLKELKDSVLLEKKSEVLLVAGEEDRLGRKLYTQKDVAQLTNTTASFVAKTIKENKEKEA